MLSSISRVIVSSARRGVHLGRTARSYARLSSIGSHPIRAFSSPSSINGIRRQTPSYLNQSRAFSVSTETLETLGDSITSAVLVSWAKEAGDSVQEDDVIAIVETDKVTMDIKAKKNGVFVEGTYQQRLCVIDSSESLLD